MPKAETRLYAVWSIAANLLLALATYFSPKLTAYLIPQMTERVWWLPWVFGILSFGAALASFIAYFDDQVPNRVAWPSILLNGAITIFIFALAHSVDGIVYSGPLACEGIGGTRHDLADTLYFSVVTFTTLGYGDFQPSSGMRGLAATEALLGYVYLGFLVGAAVHWVSAKRAAAPPLVSLTPDEWRTLADGRQRAAEDREAREREAREHAARELKARELKAKEREAGNDDDPDKSGSPEGGNG